ncbi:MAG: hypothetical protein ACRYGR_05070 [Janthinobacterium lividum]
MKSLFKKNVSFIALMAMIFYSSDGHAVVDPRALKNLTKYFNPGKENFSPIFGMMTFPQENYNIRFLGSTAPAYKGTDQDRHYIKDQSHIYKVKTNNGVVEVKDHVWILNKFLFSSAKGELALTKGGQNVTSLSEVIDPIIVARILNFVDDLRSLRTSTFKRNSNYRVNISKQVDKLKNDLKLSINKKIQNDRKDPIHNLLKEFVSIIDNALIQELEQNNDKKFLYPTHSIEKIIWSYANQCLSSQKEIWEVMLNLNSSIINDEKKEKLKSYVTQNANQSDYLTADDIRHIVQEKKPSEITLDDQYTLSYTSILLNSTNPTPFINFKMPTAAKVNVYDREKNLFSEEKFGDCVENSIGQLIQLLTWDPQSETFIIDPILDHIKSMPPYLYSENLIIYLKALTVYLVNSTDSSLRNMLNAVVADLNGPRELYDKNRIAYDCCFEDTNDLRAGFINIINVFNKILNLDISIPNESNIENDREWLKESLNFIFNKFNPRQRYLIDTESIDFDNSILRGSIKIKFLSLNNKEILSFSYSHYTQNRMISENAEILGLKNLIEENIQQKTLPYQIKQNQDLDLDLETQIYKFFFEKDLEKLSSKNLDKKYFIEDLIENYKIWSYHDKVQGMSQLKILQIQQFLKNVLKFYSFEDIEPWLLHLTQLKGLEDIFPFESFTSNIINVKDSNSEIKKFKIIPLFDLSEKFSFYNLKLYHNPSNLTFKSLMSSLKTLNLNDIKNLFKITNLENCPQLENLSIENCLEFEELVFLDKMNHLKSINLENVGLRKLDLLENCPQLKQLRIVNMHQFEQPIVLFNNQLEEIIVFNTAITNLKVFENCFELKSINVKKNRNLKDFVIYNFSSQQKVTSDTIFTVIKKLNPHEDATFGYSNLDIDELCFNLMISGDSKTLTLDHHWLDKINLSDYACLEELNIQKCHNNFEMISTIPLSNLKRINIDSSGLKEIVLSGDYPNLTEFKISENSGLKKLRFEGLLPKLSEVESNQPYTIPEIEDANNTIKIRSANSTRVVPSLTILSEADFMFALKDFNMDEDTKKKMLENFQQVAQKRAEGNDSDVDVVQRSTSSDSKTNEECRIM